MLNSMNIMYEGVQTSTALGMHAGSMARKLMHADTAINCSFIHVKLGNHTDPDMPLPQKVAMRSAR